MHRYDAVEQYFGRAYEFGYSFSVEETLEKWGREETLGDIVRVVRAFRPDVILTLPLEGTGGGQHHQAVARLTREAFRAAADAGRFPEQRREGLRPWQARKIYAGGVGGYPEALPGALVRVATGVDDPLLGLSWQQLGSRSRALHRARVRISSSSIPVRPRASTRSSTPSRRSGVSRRTSSTGSTARSLGSPALRPPQHQLSTGCRRSPGAARAAFDPEAPESAAAPLVEMLLALRALRGELDARVADAAARGELDERLAEEEADVVAALTQRATPRDRGPRGRRPGDTGRDLRCHRIGLERGPRGRRARGRQARDAGGMDRGRASRRARRARAGCCADAALRRDGPRDRARLAALLATPAGPRSPRAARARRRDAAMESARRRGPDRLSDRRRSADAPRSCGLPLRGAACRGREAARRHGRARACRPRLARDRTRTDGRHATDAGGARLRPQRRRRAAARRRFASKSRAGGRSGRRARRCTLPTRARSSPRFSS